MKGVDSMNGSEPVGHIDPEGGSTYDHTVPRCALVALGTDVHLAGERGHGEGATRWRPFQRRNAGEAAIHVMLEHIHTHLIQSKKQPSCLAIVLDWILLNTE